jgi:hypothetical protein
MTCQPTTFWGRVNQLFGRIKPRCQHAKDRQLLEGPWTTSKGPTLLLQSRAALDEPPRQHATAKRFDLATYTSTPSVEKNSIYDLWVASLEEPLPAVSTPLNCVREASPVAPPLLYFKSDGMLSVSHDGNYRTVVVKYQVSTPMRFDIMHEDYLPDIPSILLAGMVITQQQDFYRDASRCDGVWHWQAGIPRYHIHAASLITRSKTALARLTATRGTSILKNKRLEIIQPCMHSVGLGVITSDALHIHERPNLSALDVNGLPAATEACGPDYLTGKDFDEYVQRVCMSRSNASL